MRRVLYRRYPWLRVVRRRLFGVVLVLAVAPQVLDAANGWIKSDGGCDLWRVIDGDTVAMRCPDGFARLRLVGIDTPELRGGCWAETWRAMAAKQRLRWAFVQARQIDLPEQGPTDRYGRRLGEARVDGQPAAVQMIDGGWAVPYVPGDISWCERIEKGWP